MISREPRSPATGSALVLTIGRFRFSGRWEVEASPRSVAWLADRLPLQGAVLHARWSGEAGWLPLGRAPRLEPENATSHPSPGQLLLYAGRRSEPELLIPYGACAFASKAGMLAGNPVIALDGDLAALRELGEVLLWQGAQPLHLAVA